MCNYHKWDQRLKSQHDEISPTNRSTLTENDTIIKSMANDVRTIDVLSSMQMIFSEYSYKCTYLAQECKFNPECDIIEIYTILMNVYSLCTKILTAVRRASSNILRLATKYSTNPVTFGLPTFRMNSSFEAIQVWTPTSQLSVSLRQGVCKDSNIQKFTERWLPKPGES